jgi:hypothetical protein
MFFRLNKRHVAFSLNELASIQDAGLSRLETIKIAADLIDNYSYLQMIFICIRKIANSEVQSARQHPGWNETDCRKKPGWQGLKRVKAI